MEANRKNWLATVLLAVSLTACGGGGEDEADAGVTAETADEIQSALTVRQAVQQATIITGAAPKSTATDEAPELNTDGAALQSVDAGDTVNLGLTISALEGVSSLLARVVGATNYLQINDPNLSATGTTAKAFGSATVFSGQVQVQVPTSLRSGQFCIEIAAVDQAGRVSNYRKICFQVPQNLAPSAPPQVNAGGDLAVGDDVATVTLTGEVKLAELHADIPTQRAEQAQATASALGDEVFTKFPFHPGVQPMGSDRTELVLNRTWRPTISVTGARGLPSLEDAGNVLRPETSVSLSVRIAPTASSSAAAIALKEAFEVFVNRVPK